MWSLESRTVLVLNSVILLLDCHWSFALDVIRSRLMAKEYEDLLTICYKMQDIIYYSCYAAM